ncbi:hypothetical protein SAMN05720758_2578 [Fibrobacter sp. UWB11]|nr:hypothetical protein SAMN05720758_2578 [Fibrobacter sp. UWB11]
MSICGMGSNNPQNDWSILECSALVCYFLVDEYEIFSFYCVFGLFGCFDRMFPDAEKWLEFP